MQRGVFGKVFAGLTSANLRKALDQGISADDLAKVLPPGLQTALAAELDRRKAQELSGSSDEEDSQNTKGKGE